MPFIRHDYYELLLNVEESQLPDDYLGPKLIPNFAPVAMSEQLRLLKQAVFGVSISNQAFRICQMFVLASNSRTRALLGKDPRSVVERCRLSLNEMLSSFRARVSDTTSTFSVTQPRITGKEFGREDRQFQREGADIRDMRTGELHTPTPTGAFSLPIVPEQEAYLLINPEGRDFWLHWSRTPETTLLEWVRESLNSTVALRALLFNSEQHTLDKTELQFLETMAASTAGGPLAIAAIGLSLVSHADFLHEQRRSVAAS